MSQQSILRWILLAVCASAGVSPTVLGEDPQTCGPALKGQDKKSVVVIEAMGHDSTEAAIQAAEEDAGRVIVIAFEDRYLTEDQRVAKMVQKDAAKRGCEVAVITRLSKQQIGQRPVRVGGVSGATIGEPIYRHDVTVHYGRFAAP